MSDKSKATMAQQRNNKIEVGKKYQQFQTLLALGSLSEFSSVPASLVFSAVWPCCVSASARDMCESRKWPFKVGKSMEILWFCIIYIPVSTKWWESMYQICSCHTMWDIHNSQGFVPEKHRNSYKGYALSFKLIYEEYVNSIVNKWIPSMLLCLKAMFSFANVPVP